MITALLLSLPASAHVDGLLQGVDVLLAAGVGIETSFGLLRAADGEDFSWLCHEAITAEGAVITPRYTISTDGVILGVVPVPEQSRDKGLALYRTTDGCDWSTPAGTDGLVLTDAAFDPADPTAAWLISADLTDGAENHILRSDDAGQSFASVLSASERLFRTVEASPSGAVWASAVWYDRDEGYLYRSADGETFTEHPVPVTAGDEPVDVDIIAVSPDDDGTAWVVVGPYGSDVLLRTTDGGESFQEVFSVEGDIISGTAEPGGAVWIVVSGRSLYRAADGETFTLLDDAPTSLSVSAAEGVAWLATDAINGAGYIAQTSTDDGASFLPTVHLSTLSPPPTCAPDSHSALRCDPLWESLEARLPLPLTPDTGTPDTGTPDTGGVVEDDCGCGGGGGAAALLVGLLGLRRRR